MKIKLLREGKNKERIWIGENKIEQLSQIQEGKHDEIIEIIELNNETHPKDKERKYVEVSENKFKKVNKNIRKFEVKI